MSPKSGTLKSPPKGFDTSAISKTYYNLVSKQLNSFFFCFLLLVLFSSMHLCGYYLWLFLFHVFLFLCGSLLFFLLLMTFTERSCPLSYFALHDGQNCYITLHLYHIVATLCMVICICGSFGWLCTTDCIKWIFKKKILILLKKKLPLIGVINILHCNPFLNVMLEVSTEPKAMFLFIYLLLKIKLCMHLLFLCY